MKLNENSEFSKEVTERSREVWLNRVANGSILNEEANRAINAVLHGCSGYFISAEAEAEAEEKHIAKMGAVFIGLNGVREIK